MKLTVAIALASLACLLTTPASAQKRAAHHTVRCTTTYVLGGAVVTCSSR